VDDAWVTARWTSPGRGLYIVNELADDVTVEQVPGDGKIIHADFRTS
jgi:anti-sigma regulatory factor (Ser/Thr protein kinase)